MQSSLAAHASTAAHAKPRLWQESHSRLTPTCCSSSPRHASPAASSSQPCCALSWDKMQSLGSLQQHPWSPSSRRSSHLHAGPSKQRAVLLIPSARRDRGGSERGRDDREDAGGFGVNLRQGGKLIDVNLNGNRFTIDRDSLIIPALAVAGLGLVLGPIIIAVVFATAAIGAALSFGAFALSFLWVPFILAGLGAFIGGTALFGGLAGLFLPKLLGLGALAAGMGLGTVFLIVNRAQAGGRLQANSSSGGGSSKSGGSQEAPVVEAESKPVDESEEEMRRMARELRDFDTLLAEKEERARLEEWRKNR